MNNVTSKVGTNVAILVSALVLSGCFLFSHDSRGPTMDIQVYQADSTVTFRFQRPGLIARVVRVRVSIQTTEGRPDLTDLWEIVHQGPGHGVRGLAYGEIPTGFSTVTPKNGLPPALQPGKRYYVRAESDHGSWGGAGFIVRSVPSGTPERIDKDNQ